MPITGPDSYLPTVGEFLGHYASVNAALGGTAATDLKLTGNYLLATMTADRLALVAANDAIEAARNGVGNACGNRDLARFALRPGPSYDAKQEQVLLTLPATATSACTAVGLPAEGSLANYKIYVVLDSGRERGGKVLKVVCRA